MQSFSFVCVCVGGGGLYLAVEDRLNNLEKGFVSAFAAFANDVCQLHKVCTGYIQNKPTCSSDSQHTINQGSSALVCVKQSGLTRRKKSMHAGRFITCDLCPCIHSSITLDSPISGSETTV